MKHIVYIIGERGSRDWWAGILSWLGAAAVIIAALFAFSMFFLLALILTPVAALILWLHFRRIERILKSPHAASRPGATVHLAHTQGEDFRETVIDMEDED